MAEALSENFGDLLDARMRRIYNQEYAERISTSMIPLIFGMETSTRAYEIVSGIGGMSDVGDFDGTIDYDTVAQLYDKTFEFPEKAKGFKVERKLYDDDLFGIMDRRPWGLAVAEARTREKAGASIFINSFVGTDGPDSLSLCNDSHPYSPDDATTQDNKGSSSLSPVSVEATRRIGINGIFNDRGEILEVNYDTILCPVALEERGYEIINSKGKVDTANNNPNFHNGRYKMVMWPRLTDSNDWWMLDSVLAKKFLLWWDRVKPDLTMDRDFDTLMAKWAIYERYTVGWADWRPVYGHQVT